MVLVAATKPVVFMVVEAVAAMVAVDGGTEIDELTSPPTFPDS
jgi:hypothetical protein